MYPASSVSGLYFSHPEARYFSVGKIERDQVLDYQRRKGMDLRSIERWLAPNLNNDPDEAGGAAPAGGPRAARGGPERANGACFPSPPTPGGWAYRRPYIPP